MLDDLISLTKYLILLRKHLNICTEIYKNIKSDIIYSTLYIYTLYIHMKFYYFQHEIYCENLIIFYYPYS